ncbi:P1 family peptidase [Aureimonas fodinaquatilis]|uniref:P1 family peptidase n=1 Tax=Aureimonas fodinaquatilis TaxID=2565783 RepID=A0A5B0DZU4_9HYPH|nr:P1 family peptidase [Aureimonas fodinaquatilis]KAA0970739.1 P1 family peptidase [Aureimonas fodinaquatilis]
MAAWQAGKRNLITDIAGISVGNAHDATINSGSTAILFDNAVTASVAIHGGAPGTRETPLLDAENLVSGIDALSLSGGSAYGLDAPSGIQAFLRQMERGFEVAGVRVPIVPGAILFDLINGGNKDWGLHSPYRELGYLAAQNAGRSFDIGSSGAGYGATTAQCKGGLGSASTVLPNGITIGALVAVNAVGSPLFPTGKHFRAAGFELNGEFGNLGLPRTTYIHDGSPPTKFNPTPGGNTTIGVIATNARLDKGGAKRLAIAAHDGFAHALWPAHTNFDGDLVFGVATGELDGPLDPVSQVDLGAAAAATMARAIARGVYAARPATGDFLPCWSEL